eukprot:2178026-Prymnesium_polylepis.1
MLPRSNRSVLNSIAPSILPDAPTLAASVSSTFATLAAVASSSTASSRTDAPHPPLSAVPS